MKMHYLGDNLSLFATLPVSKELGRRDKLVSNVCSSLIPVSVVYWW